MSGMPKSCAGSFGLDPAARIKTLSKGQRAKLGLLTAQAHHPDLLLLDEPSSGLDPIVRNDILTAVIRTVADEGRTYRSLVYSSPATLGNADVLFVPRPHAQHRPSLVYSAPADANKKDFFSPQHVGFIERNIFFSPDNVTFQLSTFRSRRL